MTTPVRSGSVGETLVLGGTRNVAIPVAWGATKFVGSGIYGAAQKIWSWVPNGSMKQATEKAWEESSPTTKTALKVAGAVTGAGVIAATAALSLPAIGAGAAVTGVVAGVAGAGTGAATFMAEHPGHTVLFNVPMREPYIGHTPGSSSGSSADPAESFKAINEKSVEFRKFYPMELSAKPLVETEADVEKAKILKEQQEKTDKQMNRLIENGSAYTSAYFIFVNRLGLNTQTVKSDGSLGDDILMEITQAATTMTADGKKPSLWKASIECLEKHGIKLTIPQWIRAKFWYILTDFIGIVPNTFNEVGHNLLRQTRQGVKPDQAETAINGILSITSAFLDRYNGAASDYANAGRAGFPSVKGDLAVYRKAIVDKEGALEYAEQHPGIELGERVMEHLCKDFVAKIVDDKTIFPSIPFFRGLQKITFLGIRIGAFFDVMEWIFGGIINWVGKKLIKAYAPEAVQMIVKNGVGKALDGQYSFKIAIANALKTQVEDLRVELGNGIPATPRKSKAVNLKRNETIAKFLKTLELNACGEDRDAIRRKLEDLKDPSAEDQELQEELTDVSIKGAELLIYHYEQNPEAIEKLFETIFETSNEPFKVGAKIPGKEDYEKAKDSLTTSMRNLVKEQVTKAVREKIQGDKPDSIRITLNGKLNADGTLTKDAKGNPVYKGLITQQKEKAESAAKVLKGLAQKMSKQIYMDEVDDIMALLERNNPVPPAVVLATNAAVASAKAEVDSWKGKIESEKNSEEPDQIELLKMNNELIKAKIQLDVAKEQGALKKKIATYQAIEIKLNAVLSAPPPLDPAVVATTQKQLEVVKNVLDFLFEELPMVEEMRTLNGLDNPDNLSLKNLDSCMTVIDTFVEDAQELNVDLYDPMVKVLFNEVFSPIYQDFVPLSEELVALQVLQKTYEKSKKLGKIFAEVERHAAAPDARNRLSSFKAALNKIKTAEEDLRQFQADPANNVTPFEVLIKHLEDDTKALKAQEALLYKIKLLGSAEKLSDQIIAHPKRWVGEIRRRVPAGDRGPLISAIATLQDHYVQNPHSDLTAERELVKNCFTKIVADHTTLQAEKLKKVNDTLEQIKVWSTQRKTLMLKTRGESHSAVTTKLEALEENTKKLGLKSAAAKLSPVHFPSHAIVPHIPGATWLVNKHANKRIDRVLKLANSGYDFITSPEIANVSARLALGQVIHSNK